MCQIILTAFCPYSAMLNESHRRRQRLPAEVRVQQILDAALAEFSRHGYNAARMEDIAQAAGLSKGGLYAHFPSKESLLQKLLERVLEAPLLENLHWWPSEARSLEDLVDAFVDHTLQRLTDPSILPTIRLLLAEAPRLPASMQDWHKNMMRMHAENHERLMQRAIAEGFLTAPEGLTDCSILMLPMTQSLFMILASGEAPTPASIEALRPQHRLLLLRLLRP